MAGRLENKVAIVTGAGCQLFGFERACAVLFAREGARVVLVDRNAEAIEETRALVVAEGGEAHSVVADVSAAEGPTRSSR